MARNMELRRVSQHRANLRYRRALRERLVNQHGGKCRRCGSTFALQFAHVYQTELKGMGRGRYERLIDVIRNPDAYTLLCPHCHSLYDNGHINLDEDVPF